MIPAIQTNTPDLLTLPQVEQKVGFKRSTIYALIASAPPRFPAPIKPLGARASRWVSTDIDAWIQQQIKAARLVGAV